MDCKEEIAFCLAARGKSTCIREEKGCLCPGCPVLEAEGFSHVFYCIRGTETDHSHPREDWKCHVCGFIHKDDSPPGECPQCASTGREFEEIREKKKLRYDGEKFDVLLINGSNHRANNTGYMVDLVEEVLEEKGVSYRRYNINEFMINHCWCCYSMRDNACRYPAGTDSMICRRSTK